MPRCPARLSLFVIAAMLFILSSGRPASAAVTAAALTATSPSYSGSCPATMAFTGTITGSPGTTFQYSYNRFINGVQQIQNIGLMTIPPGGSIAVADSFSVSSTSSGVNFDQLWIHNIAGGQGDVYSPRAPFSVTCGGGTSPTAHNFKTYQIPIANVVSSVFKIPAPYGAKTTNDVTECGKHLTGLSVFLSPVCGEVLAQGGADIVFKWDGNGKYPDVDGFRAYDADTHLLDSKITSSAGSSVTVLFKRPPLPSGCYVVRAYKGSDESADSNRVCFYPTTTKSVTLNPTDFYTWGPYSDEAIDYSQYNATPRISEGVTIVGYWHMHPLQIQSPSVRRAGLYYNLNSLGAHFIFKAILHLKVFGTTTDPNAYKDPTASEFPSTLSCLYEIAPGNAKWWLATGEPTSNFDDVQRPNAVAELALDVTSWARPWLNDQVNFGLVMRGSDENRNERANNRCETQFYTPTLEVTYN